MEQRLYLLGRADLKPGLRAAQVGHAAFAFALEHPEVTRRWHPNYLILLEVQDLAELQRYERNAARLHLRYSTWYEPDLQGELTAVAIAPSRLAKLLVRRLPLLLLHDTYPGSSTTEQRPLKPVVEGLSPSSGTAAHVHS